MLDACRQELRRISGGPTCSWRLFRSALRSLGVSLDQRQFVYICNKYDPNGRDEFRYDNALDELDAMMLLQNKDAVTTPATSRKQHPRLLAGYRSGSLTEREPHNPYPGCPYYVPHSVWEPRLNF